MRWGSVMQSMIEDGEASFGALLLQLDVLRFCLVVALPFVATFSEINFSLGNVLLGSVELAMLCSLGLLLWRAWREGSRTWMEQVFLLHAAVLFGLLFFVGGFSDIGFVWSLGFPFLACIVAGSLSGAAWSAVYMLAIVLGAWLLDIALAHGAAERLYIALAYFAMAIVAYGAAVRSEQEEKMIQRMREEIMQLRRALESL
ncbi:MAG: hypothetical protein D6678_03520 [Zetaproteobacteria bacterium]|nr:MAG: hypothetical protein D6678_03520 [Zetaproteobacteria bacterium]